MIDKGWLTVGGIGRRAIDTFLRLGFAARFLGLTLRNSGVCLRRPRLVVREVYFSGVLSLVIILVSGLFVGMVLGLQGYQTLRTYGSESALGVLVALSLLRELGPVITALLGVDEGSFWSQMQNSVDFREDIVNGLLKSLAFGFAISWIAVFEGYDAPPTAEGVSGATTRTVVTSALTILFLDYILTSLMFRGL